MKIPIFLFALFFLFEYISASGYSSGRWEPKIYFIKYPYTLHGVHYDEEIIPLDGITGYYKRIGDVIDCYATFRPWRNFCDHPNIIVVGLPYQKSRNVNKESLIGEFVVNTPEREIIRNPLRVDYMFNVTAPRGNFRCSPENPLSMNVKFSYYVD